MNTKKKIIKLKGIILRESDYKEYDKLLEILTDELGKISVYAFSVRKANSKKLGSLQLFTLGEFELIYNDGLYVLDDIKVLDSFSDISKDYEKTCYASYFIEFVEYFSHENIESKDLLTLLIYTFIALEKNKMEYRLIRRVFELKVLQYEGLYRGVDALKSTNKVLLYTWKYILDKTPKNVFSFNLTDNIMNLLEKEIDFDINKNVEKKFKTLKFL